MSPVVPIAVLDYGSGNLHSACRAIAAAGAEVVLSSRVDEIKRCRGLVVPGVGAFASCMAGIRKIGGDELIADWVEAGRPLLGICVGHQVLFSGGIEHGVQTSGLGLLPGIVEQVHSVRLPHMGWNTITASGDSLLFAGIGDQRFYFVHSYAARLEPLGTRSDVSVASADHGGDRFVAAVECGPISSTQFHPEKSGEAGGRLLRNWLARVVS